MKILTSSSPTSISPVTDWREANDVFAIPTAPQFQGSANVATTSTAVVAANASRTVLSLSNGSDTGIWLWFAASGAVVGQGHFLAPGQQFVENYMGAVSAVHVGVSGTKTLGVVEF